MKTPDIIVKGKNNGDGMVIHYRSTKETNVFGLAVPSMHADIDWDLGPTWCYLISGRKTTLIDTGRPESLEALERLLQSVDRKLTDINRVIVTHSHEDHDGNLADLLAEGRAELWAHSIYSKMISDHPQILDGATHPELPGSCRLCVMPPHIRSKCLTYLKKRGKLDIDVMVDGNYSEPNENLRFVFTPGHTADSICIILDDEILFTGDTILSNITPHPSTTHCFHVNRRILPDKYSHRNTVYGLLVYLNSLRMIAGLASEPFHATFPAHRLYYNGQFNLISNPSDRAREIIRFHMDRCRDILSILGGNKLNIEEIAERHFDPSLLAGTGRAAARNEIVAHIEVMEDAGDIRWVDQNREVVQSTGSDNYLHIMGKYLN